MHVCATPCPFQLLYSNGAVHYAHLWPEERPCRLAFSMERIRARWFELCFSHSSGPFVSFGIMPILLTYFLHRVSWTGTYRSWSFCSEICQCFWAPPFVGHPCSYGLLLWRTLPGVFSAPSFVRTLPDALLECERSRPTNTWLVLARLTCFGLAEYWAFKRNTQPLHRQTKQLSLESSCFTLSFPNL